jgi:hypothetical protein
MYPVAIHNTVQYNTKLYYTQKTQNNTHTLKTIHTKITNTMHTNKVST